MSLNDWLNNGWVKPHETSSEEIQNLLKIIKRDLADSKISDLSSDWCFAITYNAALQICTTALYCSGYKTARGQSEHYRVIQSLTLTLGDGYSEIRDYLNSCRAKRNISDYDMAGTISGAEVREIITITTKLFEDLKSWIHNNHPQYSFTI